MVERSTFAAPSDATSGLAGYDLEGASRSPHGAPRPLYVARPLIETEAFRAWAEAAGFPSSLDDLHVTIALSKSPIKWSDTIQHLGIITIPPGDAGRSVKALGDNGAVVLKFASDELARRWEEFRDIGASWDFEEYLPHVTITYDGKGVDISKVAAYAGELKFGPEVFAAVDDDEAGSIETPLKGAGMNKPLKVFVPIRKVDIENRLVYGQAAAEMIDSYREVMDYATTKPEFEKWSEAISKASDGKSLGNVRAMHGPIAAGKLTALTFDDATKTVDCCAKIVDEAEWQKCLEGVYTGFSLGGKYVNRWKDAGDPTVTRYTASIVEVSIVDSPAIPTATFDAIKADGTVEVRKFASVVAEPANDDIVKRAQELAKAANSEVFADFITAARDSLIADAVVKGAEKDDATAAAAIVEKAAAESAELVQVWKAKDGSTHPKKADAIAANVAIDAAAVAKAAGDPLAEKLAALGTSMAAIDTATKGESSELAALKTSIEDFAKIVGPKALAKRQIIHKARALKALDALPAGWLTARVAAKGADVQKTVTYYSVAQGLVLLSQLEDLEENTEYDSDFLYGDVANIGPELKTRFGSALVEFGDIIAEMLDAVLAKTKEEEAAEQMGRSQLLIDVMKIGARNSKSDSALLNQAHEAMVKLGAECSAGKATKAADADEVTKITGELDTLKAANAALVAERDALKASNGAASDAVDKMVANMERLTKQVESFARTPVPSKLIAVEKGREGAAGNSGGFDISKLSEMTPTQAKELLDQMAVIAVKAAQSRPLQALERGR